MLSVARQNKIGQGASRLLAVFSRYSDVSLAALAVAIIALMVLPLPAWALDALIAVNIASGVLLLLFALYVPTPLAFSTFPSVLLFTTLFRISLNVATTRQILLTAHAGDIIDTFGRLVVGGSLIVGLVVFIIITLVQFIVVAKGAERVAEVGARFVLDALPGKQMSIDSDMRAGLISQAEAVERRRTLALESQFFGSMDGAMKFVKGDAIASIVVVIVNLLGGMAVGVLVNDLSAGQAAQKYLVLAIGDGLVTQIPALFIAMAAGVVVTRTSPDKAEHLAMQIGGQLASQPKALLISGGVLGLFALVPGFPSVTFVLLGAAVSAAGFVLGRRAIAEAATKHSVALTHAGREGEADSSQRLTESSAATPFSPLAVELGAGIVQALSVKQFDAGLEQLRKELRRELGLPFPGVSPRWSSALQPGECRVLLHETPFARFVLDEQRALVSAPKSKLDELGIDVFSDAALPYGFAAGGFFWVDQKNLEKLRGAGIYPIAVHDILLRALRRVLMEHPRDFVGVQETKHLLSALEKRYPDLVREALAVMPLPRLADMLAALLGGGIPIRDMRSVLEAVVDVGGQQISMQQMYDQIRSALARSLCERVSDGNSVITSVCLSQGTEELVRTNVHEVEGLPQLTLPPEEVKKIADQATRAFADALPQDKGRAVLLVAPDLRGLLKAALEPFISGLTVLAYSDVVSGYSVKRVADI